jgi:hypothetical protein
LDKRVGELLEDMPHIKVAIEPLLRVLEQLVAERKALDNRLAQAHPAGLGIPAADDHLRRRSDQLTCRVSVNDRARFDSPKATDHIADRGYA